MCCFLSQGPASKSYKHVFQPMKSNQRRFIHELSIHYGCDTSSFDPEPLRNVTVYATRWEEVWQSIYNFCVYRDVFIVLCWFLQFLSFFCMCTIDDANLCLVNIYWKGNKNGALIQSRLLCLKQVYVADPSLSSVLQVKGQITPSLTD